MDKEPWGKSVSIDLFDCELSRISDPEVIRGFFPEIIKKIKMEAHGPIHMDRFGEGELEGWSGMQFIKTSSITVHCDEPDQRCFIDIFSCRDFDERAAEEAAKEYFQAKVSRLSMLLR